MNIGHEWLNNYSPKDNSNTQRQDLLVVQAQVEEDAKLFCDDLRTHVIPTVIQNCILDQRQTFGVYAMSWHLNSEAFTGFRSWLADQGLVCVCGKVQSGDPDAQEHDVILNIMPKSSF